VDRLVCVAFRVGRVTGILTQTLSGEWWLGWLVWVAFRVGRVTGILTQTEGSGRGELADTAVT
jgi:hypothetical protein